VSSDTLLAHLAQRLGHGAENLATEALAFILQNPAAARGMASHTARWEPNLAPAVSFRTQDWLKEDEAIPDLVAVARDQSTPLIVEAKFGAALTPNQPVTYLRRLLAAEAPGLLLFLVPTRRKFPIWAELRRRCDDAGLPLVTSGETLRGVNGQAVVGVTSWADLLDDIDRHLVPVAEHRQTIAELEQLRGLCERADRNVFQPLTTQFLGGDTGQRLAHIDELLNEAVANLADRQMAVTKGLRWSSGQGWFGRYFLLAGWECLLHVHFESWGTTRDTPLWLRVTDRRAAANHDLQDSLRPLDAAEPSRLFEQNGQHHIPIHLPSAVERDAVFTAIESQLKEIHALLENCPPPPRTSETQGS